jgi:1-deoxy-D-xylulose-5-phosphate reductoisomerase
MAGITHPPGTVLSSIGAIDASEAPSLAAPYRVTVLGATGSVGMSTLDLVARSPERFEVVALTAQVNVERLAELAIRHRARVAVIGLEGHLAELKSLLSGTGIEARAGCDEVAAAAEEPADCVMAAIVGAAGLRPTFAAARQGRRVALANKECLVSAGDVFLAEVARAGAELIPVDSEHSAVFQAIGSTDPTAIESILLTASGGPFRTFEMDRLRRVTPEEALKHPNWSMGAKITIDSATLMNKGLELIEAFHLFPVGAHQLGAIVHPQSIVHCLVSLADGSVLAHLSKPDMRTPIAVALAWPDRMSTPVERLDLLQLQSLTFEAPDETRFPALRLAREALYHGGGAPAVLNAANEIAVQAFLDRKLGFLDIAHTVASCLEQSDGAGLLNRVHSLEDVINVDREARLMAEALIGR